MNLKRSIAPLTIATHPRMIAAGAATVVGCPALLMGFVLSWGASTASAATTYTIEDLGSFSVEDINDSGEVAGFMATSISETHAFLYSGGQMQDLGTLGGTSSSALGINDLGEVVRFSVTPSEVKHAFLYPGGQMQDLNNLIPAGSGWELINAKAINTSGQIVGGGKLNGQNRAYLATPATSPTCDQTGTVKSDTLTGTSGADVICGGKGNDTIKGLGGNDILLGEEGNDKLLGGVGDDTFDGGTGNDTASYSASLAAVTASLATNSATGEGSDSFMAVEDLLGSSKDDTLTGSDANNNLTGGGGNDTERGGSGNDQVIGSGGADFLFGEDGNDTVNSKDGVNRNDCLDGGSGTDAKITDGREKSIVGFP